VNWNRLDSAFPRQRMNNPNTALLLANPGRAWHARVFLSNLSSLRQIAWGRIRGENQNNMTHVGLAQCVCRGTVHQNVPVRAFPTLVALRQTARRYIGSSSKVWHLSTPSQGQGELSTPYESSMSLNALPPPFVALCETKWAYAAGNANIMDPKTSYHGWECGRFQKMFSLCVYFCQIGCSKSKAGVREDTFVISGTPRKSFSGRVWRLLTI